MTSGLNNLILYNADNQCCFFQVLLLKNLKSFQVIFSRNLKAFQAGTEGSSGMD